MRAGSAHTTTTTTLRYVYSVRCCGLVAVCEADGEVVIVHPVLNWGRLMEWTAMAGGDGVPGTEVGCVARRWWTVQGCGSVGRGSVYVPLSDCQGGGDKSTVRCFAQSNIKLFGCITLLYPTGTLCTTCLRFKSFEQPSSKDSPKFGPLDPPRQRRLPISHADNYAPEPNTTYAPYISDPNTTSAPYSHCYTIVPPKSDKEESNTTRPPTF